MSKEAVFNSICSFIHYVAFNAHIRSERRWSRSINRRSSVVEARLLRCAMRLLAMESSAVMGRMAAKSTGESGSCDACLIGTAHASKESCREVQAVISILKPEAVFVELCSSRFSILKPQTLKEQSDTVTLLCKVFIKISVGDKSQRTPTNLRFGSII
ncbi:hypothetical protein Bca4012_062529 [Brassica carinata]